MQNETMFDRIQQRLKALDMSERQASMLAVENPDLVRNLKRNRSTSPRGGAIPKLASVLGVTEAWLLGSSDEMESPAADGVFGVRFGGIVEAGAWRVNDELNQEAGFRTIPIPFDTRYPREAQYAFEVFGDSMTESGIFEGMFVLAVDVHTWQRLHGEPEDRKLVVVACTHNGDPQRELTVKQLRIFRDRMELRPQSRNPQWQPIVFSNPPREDEEAEAQIIAVVLSATRIY